jgi:hypothetical protein
MHALYLLIYILTLLSDYLTRCIYFCHSLFMFVTLLTAWKNNHQTSRELDFRHLLDEIIVLRHWVILLHHQDGCHGQELRQRQVAPHRSELRAVRALVSERHALCPLSHKEQVAPPGRLDQLDHILRLPTNSLLLTDRVVAVGHLGTKFLNKRVVGGTVASVVGAVRIGAYDLYSC